MTRILTAALALVAMSARAEEIDYKKLYSTASPAVVLIYGEQGQVGSVGTGSIIDRAGLVVTNAHVILNHDTKQPFPKLFIFLKPDKITGQNEQDLKRGFKAQLLAYNAALDLAVLAIERPPEGLPVVPLAEDEVGVGEATAAIGHPEHGAKWSLTTGRIGGNWANFEGVAGKDVYQMETSVNRGNSGGPLLDGNGYMVGINTSIARRSEDGLAITGINFALKSAVVRRWLGETLPQVDLKQAKAPEPPPAPKVVAAAEPPPLEPERKETAPAAEKKDQITARAKPGAETLAPPAAPPEGKRGYASSEPPGKTLTPTEAVRWRAKRAFDALDEEEKKHQSKKAGK
jgi:serine protease Do